MPDHRVEDRLAALRTALANGDYEAAEDALAELSELYEELEADERTLKRKVTALRETGDVAPDDHDALRRFLQTATATEFRRTGLLTGGLGLVVGDSPDELAPLDDLETSAADLEEQERSFRAAAETVEEATEEYDIPPRVTIRSVATPERIPLEEEKPVTVTVANVGDETAGDLELAVDGGEGVSIAPATVSVGTLGAGERAEETVDATGTSVGLHEATVELDSSDAGHDTRQVDLRVAEIDPPDVCAYTDEEGRVTTAALFAAVADYREGDIGLEVVLDVLAAWQGGDPIPEC